ncbi:MAG: hypothetical protein JW795_09940, partial [Chitinivibrionales bacterium]|nr:hypothetical protein [Chitinivibrionales bacterium]
MMTKFRLLETCVIALLLIPIMTLAQRAMVQAAPSAQEKVALIVDKELEAPLMQWGAAYMQKVQRQFNVEFVYYALDAKGYTAAKVREGLQYLYRTQHITGAMLVGFWPVYKWETQSGRAVSMAATLPYEDLEGSEFLDLYQDTTINGSYFKKDYYDTYTWGSEDITQREMEIWVSLIRPLQSAPHDYA